MNLSKAVKMLLLTFVVSTTAAFAQQQQMQMQQPQIQPAESVSEPELEQFVDVAMDIQSIQQEADKKVMEKLDEEGMSRERFQQIMMGMQNPNAPQVELTDAEEKTIANMQSFLQQVNMTLQQDQMEVINESEMSPQRFQSIAMALRTDQDLAMRFQEKAAEMEETDGTDS